MGKVSKVGYSSKAKGFNVRDFLLLKDTVHTRKGFQILSKKNYQINDLGTAHEPPNTTEACLCVRFQPAILASRRVDRIYAHAVFHANRVD
jgi:hypothetical protein